VSIDTDIVRADEGGGGLGVDIELTGALVARAGARQGRVVVPAGSTVADAVTTWADRYGSHLRLALLEGDRLRSTVSAVRVADGGEKRLVASEPLRNGDTIRFEFRE
jgi:hypothetical protein